MCCWFLSQFAAYSDSVWNLLKFCIIHTVIYKVGENKNATKFQPGDAWTFHRNINLIKTHSTGEITIFLTFGKRIIISLKEIWLEKDVKWENITKKDHTLPEALILLHECSETLTAKSILILHHRLLNAKTNFGTSVWYAWAFHNVRVQHHVMHS